MTLSIVSEDGKSVFLARIFKLKMTTFEHLISKCIDITPDHVYEESVLENDVPWSMQKTIENIKNINSSSMPAVNLILFFSNAMSHQKVSRKEKYTLVGSKAFISLKGKYP